jgi:hypothetical protein
VQRPRLNRRLAEEVRDTTTTPIGGGRVAEVSLWASELQAGTLPSVGVARRAAWARVTAIIAGVAVSVTCLGLVLGIPIIIAAARAPLGATLGSDPPGG